MNYAFLLLISFPAFARIIYPSPVMTAPDHYLADCHAENPDDGFTEAFLESDGILTVRVNPKFKTLDPHLASFLAFDGLTVVKNDPAISISGAIMMMGDTLPVDLKLTRGEQTEVFVGRIKLLCSVN